MKQDSIGNIYITKHGSDPDLASIALGFALDSIPAKDTVSGALNVFQNIVDSDIRCGLTLVGWSTPSNTEIGKQVWDNQIPTSAGTTKATELKHFSGLKEASNFSFSALFEIIEDDNNPLIISGSPVTTQRVFKLLSGQPCHIEDQDSLPQRAPFVSLRGKAAVSVGTLAVKDYGDYVAALFENFD